MKAEAEKIANKLVKSHTKTIFYNEGDLDKLEKSIAGALVRFVKSKQCPQCGYIHE